MSIVTIQIGYAFYSIYEQLSSTQGAHMDKDPGNTGEKEKKKEVERKFLIDRESIPHLTRPSKEDRLYQAYIAIAEDGSETRVRMTEPHSNEPKTYELTVKTKGDVSRGEETIPISEEMFYSLSDSYKREGNLIVKVRLSIPYGDEIIELDIYDGGLTGLIVAEVEFHGATEAEALEKAADFVTPDWFGLEVTDDKRYKNQSLALNGLPE